ncbi:MAG TPA: OmpA family protein [Alphaproteobacteria bacterium]|nr:OmpA family protein [Alphaproteobacteria bacterium]
MTPLKRSIARSALVASVLGLAACASTTPNATLQQAEVQVGALGQDPAVARYAPLEAERARQYLAQAQSSAYGGADEPAVTHQAYLASQQAEIARQVAAAKAAQEEVARADATRAQALLAARTQQAQQAQQQAQQSQAEAARLRQELQNMQSRQTERGVVLTLGNVLFQTDSAELVPGAAQQMDQLATVLRQHPDYTVEIDGFTDSTGSDAYNLALSQRRAESVRRELALRGINPSRLTARGHGEASPVASNETDLGRQMNRRVEVLIAGPGLAAEQSSGTVTRPSR